MTFGTGQHDYATNLWSGCHCCCSTAKDGPIPDTQLIRDTTGRVACTGQPSTILHELYPIPLARPRRAGGEGSLL